MGNALKLQWYKFSRNGVARQTVFAGGTNEVSNLRYFAVLTTNFGISGDGDCELFKQVFEPKATEAFIRKGLHLKKDHVASVTYDPSSFVSSTTLLQ